MELNRIYRHYAIPRNQIYGQLKSILNEAFIGFNGVSFETVAATESSDEQFLIYLNSEKSMWLNLHHDDNDALISVNFKNENARGIGRIGSAVSFRQFSIVRTAYGVIFSRIGTSNTSTDILNDAHLVGFFVQGEPNIFVLSEGSNNSTDTSWHDHCFYSDLHEIPEIFRQPNSLIYASVPRTSLLNACSAVQPIKSEHLYRAVFSDEQTGKIEVDNKYFIKGNCYALEYDPKDDGVEINTISQQEEG